MEQYLGLTFATVRNAGHMVRLPTPQYPILPYPTLPYPKPYPAPVLCNLCKRVTCHIDTVHFSHASFTNNLSGSVLR